MLISALFIISILPLAIHYLFADAIGPLLHHVIRYRRDVLETNLRKAFPEKSEKERKQIARQYYHHMADLLAEALYCIRCTPPKLKKHYHIANREIADRYFEQGQSIILLSSHYNNWEYMVCGLNMLFLHHGVGVGKPLTDAGLGIWINKRRTRYGTEVVDQSNVREVFEYYHKHQVPCAYMMLADQSPNDVHKCYWTEFLHQESGFIYGPEYFARKYNYPVIYYEVKKVKRGHYEVTLEEICSQPQNVPQYEITKVYINRLEQLLNREPAYWLWTHRRWKRERPPEIPFHAKE